MERQHWREMPYRSVEDKAHVRPDSGYPHRQHSPLNKRAKREQGGGKADEINKIEGGCKAWMLRHTPGFLEAMDASGLHLVQTTGFSRLEANLSPKYVRLTEFASPL